MIASPADSRCPPFPPQTGPAHSELPVFRITADDDGRVHLTISGDLDITTVPILTDHLASLAGLRPTGLVIDLSGVSFLDCVSARLLAATSELLPAGRHPVLAAARPAVRRLLEILGLAGIMLSAD